MNIFRSFGDVLRYLAEGVACFFGEDHYPEIGVQPFTGDCFSKWVDFEQLEK